MCFCLFLFVFSFSIIYLTDWLKVLTKALLMQVKSLALLSLLFNLSSIIILYTYIYTNINIYIL